MIVENKRTGEQIELTLEQWANLERSGNSRGFRILDAGIIDKVEKVEFKQFSTIPEAKHVVLDVGYKVDYRKLLDAAGIKYNKNIKSEDKLKEIYEGSVVTTHR